LGRAGSSGGPEAPAGRKLGRAGSSGGPEARAARERAAPTRLFCYFKEFTFVIQTTRNLRLDSGVRVVGQFTSGYGISLGVSG
ncbi:MAG TPA: hypothetical protein VKJ45_22685, partial [Blastocatellia bacterium]|nr:hypothetical protein [Blastocatellia bacterium]